MDGFGEVQTRGLGNSGKPKIKVKLLELIYASYQCDPLSTLNKSTRKKF